MQEVLLMSSRMSDMVPGQLAVAISVVLAALAAQVVVAKYTNNLHAYTHKYANIYKHIAKIYPRSTLTLK